MPPSGNMPGHREALQPDHYPETYVHDHPPVVDINQVFEERLSLGQRASDWIAKVIGCWTFIVLQSVILVSWAILNIVGWMRHWDPYPFILMNLFLSMQAAYTAPIIMMSQNRQAMKDRIEAHNDFMVNQKAEEEIRVILEHLEAQNRALMILHEELLRQGKNRDLS